MSRLSRLVIPVATVLVVFGSAKLHARHVGYDLSESLRLTWISLYAVLLLLSTYAVGLPDLTRTRRTIVASSVGACGLAAIGMSLATLGLGTGLLPRFVVFGSALVLTPVYVLSALMCTDSRSRAQQRDRVIVVGSWTDAAQLTVELDESAERPAQVIDVLDVESASSNATTRPLVEAATMGEATVIVLDREAQVVPSIVDQAAELHELGLRVRSLSLFYEEWLGKLPVSELERVSLMFDIGELHRARYARAKRLVDVSLASVGLLVLAPVLLLALLGNVVGNRGPLFFVQARVGKNGRQFRMIKLRTMRPDGDGATVWTRIDDPRITAFGRFLRRSHLDELPQVLNILKGDLSIVGPRPEQPHYVAELSTKLPFYAMRHTVRPGLTGWAQVKYGYAGDDRDALEKLQYEFYYLRRQGLMLDVRIVLRTIRSVLGRDGR